MRRLFSTACVSGAILWILAADGRADDRFGARDSAAVDQAAGRTEAGAAAGRLSSKERIEALIRQLGSPRFSDRRAAANELNHIGPEAFDQLQAATESTDPEIAASARYLLRQINVRWTRSDDTARVRRILRDYGDQDDTVREQIAELLGKLPAGEGIAALCRIARFDRSALISRQAAAAIIHPSDDVADRSIDPVIFDRELGDSTRVASQWLRQYQAQLRDPAASLAGWRQLIDDESRRLEENVDETSLSVVSDLLWNLAEVYQRLGDTTPLVEVADRIVEVNGEESDQSVWKLLEWFLKREAWDAVDQFATRQDGRIRRSKPSLYLLAMARSTQGNYDAAEELAGEALELPARSDLESIQAARIVSELGQFEWAVREYRHTLDNKSLKTPEAVAACTLLSNLLQDYQQYQESAEVIEPLMKLVEGKNEFAGQYRRYRGALNHLGIILLDVHAVSTRYHFMRACDSEQQRDFPQQREQLLLAIGHDEEDADVLIAMYRSEDADDAWREATLKRIHELANDIDQNIEEEPDNPVRYNQWAWLVANTEGDYRKAVRYSRRSLELWPNTASFLDTLGRCYYAAGDLENAVQAQRKAVRLIPHMQVMQRQLALFEKALADEKGTGIGGQGSGNAD